MEDGTDFDEGGEEEYNAPGQAAEGAEEDAGAEEGGEEYGEESGAAEEEVSITAATVIKSFHKSFKSFHKSFKVTIKKEITDVLPLQTSY